MATSFDCALEQHNTDVFALYDRYMNGELVKDIAKTLGVCGSTLRSHIRKEGFLLNKYYNHHSKIPFNETVFNTIDTPKEAYWLGFLAADGSIWTRKVSPSTDMFLFGMELCNKDINHLINFADFIDYPTNKIKYREGFCKLETASQAFCASLVKKGIIPHKTTKLDFPEINDNLIRYWIAGFIDGDETILINRKSLVTTLISASEKVLIGINEYIHTHLNIPLKSVSILKPKNPKYANMYRINWYSNEALKVINHVYSDIETIALERKFRIADKYANTHNINKDDAIKRSESYKVRNFNWNISEEELRRLYEDEKYNTIEIGDMFDISKTTVQERMKQFGIPRRNASNSKIVHYSKSDTLSPVGRKKNNFLFDISSKLLTRYYIDEQMTVQKIAQIFNVSPSTINQRIKHYGLVR